MSKGVSNRSVAHRYMCSKSNLEGLLEWRALLLAKLRRRSMQKAMCRIIGELQSADRF